MRPLVVYHADCTDGFGAAFAAWLKLGDKAEYIPVQYGSKEHENVSLLSPEGRDVYVLDFSFPRVEMDVLFEVANRVIWLDHHKTAFEMWCGEYERGQLLFEEDDVTGKYTLLDDNKSGALLAWEYFHGNQSGGCKTCIKDCEVRDNNDFSTCSSHSAGKKVPTLIRYIDDRDRWQFKLKGSRELHASLASYKPWTFNQWRDWTFSLDHNLDGPYLDDLRINSLIDEGGAILRAQDLNVQRMANQARRCRLSLCFEEDYVGLSVNACIHQSELGHELVNQSGTFGLVWYLSGDNEVKCSIRSNGDYDVSVIARHFGGGGHRNAAGFSVPLFVLMGWLK